jgi:hypothetical protein
VTTAAGITAVVDLVLQQPKQYQGFVPQEKFSMPDILRNRFGRYFAQGGTKDLSAEVVVTGKAGRQRRLTSTATR